MTTATALPAPGSAAWHAVRALGIGSSEVAMLFGKSPYGGPLQVYLNKTTDPGERKETREQRRGTRMEAYLADEAAERFGWTLVQVPTQVHPDEPICRSSPDRPLIEDGAVTAVVEVKTARSRAGWLDPEEDATGVPFHYLLQCQQQMGVGVLWNGVHYFPKVAHLIACVGSLDDFRHYVIPFNAKLWAVMRERQVAFWRDHVVPRIPPAFDGSDDGDRLLKLQYPEDTRPTLLKADAAADGDLFDLQDARRAFKAAETAVKIAEQRIKDRIGENAGIEGAAGRVTWKKNRDSTKVDAEAVSGDLLRALGEAIGVPRAQAIAAESSARNLITRAGARVLRCSFTQGE